MSQLRPVVRVDAGADSDDLLEALSVRGFEARRLDGGEIEVEPSSDDDRLWTIEVVSALEAWLEDEGRPALVAHVGGAEYTVRAPEGRDEPDFVELEPDEPEPRSGPDFVVIAATLGAVMLLAAGIWLIVSAVSQTM